MSALASASTAPRVGGEVDDQELVRRVRRADERAFETLYHRYHRRITAYIFGMVHDHGRAEDIAQDVFVSALRRMRETDRPIAFKPWIYEIAKNACIDQFRRTRRAEEVSYDADEGLGAADYGRLVSTASMPEAELDSKTQLDHLCGAFGGLSETHHEILVMRELEGLSYREIGERLNMSRPSVESTLFRARRRLTEEYEELVTGARCQRIQSIIGSASAGEVGLRDQRRLARHVSHCQPCRRQARVAGLDIPVTADRPVRQRIAAMLPLPLFLRRRWLGDVDSASTAGPSPLGGLAHLSVQFGSSFDPSWIKAAATAATVAVAGVGAGLAAHQPSASQLGTSVTPVSDSRSGVHDELAAQVTRASVGVAGATPTSGATPARHGASSASSGSTSRDGGTTTSAASAPAVAAPTDNVTAAAPDVDQVTGQVGSGADGSLPPQPAPPSSPLAGGSPLPTPPVSTTVAAPNPTTAITDATDALTGATQDAGQTVDGLLGGG